MYNSSNTKDIEARLMTDTINQNGYTPQKQQIDKQEILVQDQQQYQQQLPVYFDERGHFFMRVGNNCCQPCVQTVSMPMPCIQMMPFPFPCCGQKKQKKKKTDNKELELLRQRVRELESRGPEVRIQKEIVQVKDQEQVMKLEKELHMVKFQLESELERSKSKDAQIIDLKQQLNKNDLSRSSSLQILQKQLVDRERQITQQDADIGRLRSHIEELEQNLEEANQRIAFLEHQSEEVSVEKITYLNKELDIWKQKFIQLNRDYHTNQEKMLMLEAELESIKKSDIREVKQVTVEKKTFGGKTVDIRSSQYETRRSQYKEQQ